jgi:hypothetical protein
VSSGRASILVSSVALFVACAAPRPAAAYSVLAHESLIDSAWDRELRPLIHARFPSANTAELDEARAYAYGGSLIQDLGYYPFGNKFFSNLLHYVRSGDFVEVLLRDARDPDEYAFALGALAHYAADNVGHPDAVNLSVPMIFPKLREKYGDRITYVEAPAEHIITEFSFDVVETAGGAYLPEAYRRFIGFEVAKPLLERAFLETYGIEMKDVFANEDLAIGTYRYSVSQLFPALTREAWKTKRDEIVKHTPGMEERAFLFAYSRADYETTYGSTYQKPGLVARILAFLYRFVPKIGPLKPLSIKALTPESEKLFEQSVALARQRFQAAVQQVRDGGLQLRNTDFDTGKPARHGEYRLADDTYAELLHRLAATDRSGSPGGIRQNVLMFYGPAPSPAPGNKHDRKHWTQIRGDLQQLK